ncbi:hypothetical protein LCGC14_3157860 [marine sediment metagenome]|uniref:Uncharacterized protein n=1 Tax=marine sediment metagenome TaxID=412755 RepID=A0A0F8VS43_9ZZZZ
MKSLSKLSAAELEEVRKLGASVLGYEKRIVVFPDPNPPETVTTTEGPTVYIPNKRTEPLNGRNKRTRGRPRKWASEAERKRAYRERSK